MTNNKLNKPGKSGLISIVGLCCASILYVIVPKFEGNELTGYLDPVGIPTKCAGDTTDVIVGKEYTEEHCFESLETQLAAHAEPVLKCTPILKDKPDQLAAAVSFAYNIGVGAYCRSTAARKFNEGDLKGACAELSRWVYAGGQKLPGLVKRRAEERALCEKGL